MLRSRNAEFVADPTGADPREILVFDLVGTATDFYNAVKRIDGLEWLLDQNAGPVEADEDFYYEGELETTVSSRVLVMSTNQTALRELLRLFRLYRRGDELPRNFGTLKDLFAHVSDVRPWSFRDRISGTGIAEYIEELAKIQAGEFLCTLELFNSGDAANDAAALARVGAAVRESGGRVVSAVAISEIRHSEIRAQIPLPHIVAIASLEDIAVFRLADVMFIRPAAQARVLFEEGMDDEEPASLDIQGLRETERIALLDGVPIANHPLLTGRLNIDDPDGFEANAPVAQRLHGTAMASLILNGDLALNQEPLHERLYLRPILLPRAAWAGKFVEEIPDEMIPVDLLHQAVTRMFEGDAPLAPGIRIVCLCVADATRPVDLYVSAWARLVDYLAWKYGIVFLISAGNQHADFEVPLTNILGPDGPTDNEIDDAVVSALVANSPHRRILSPAEALNALTIGASSSDGSAGTLGQFIPLTNEGTERPAVFNPAGFGFRNSVKPEVFFPGGRQELAIRANTPGQSSVTGVDRMRPPGQRVAAPPRQEAHIRGTSNATATAAREALGILDVLPEIVQDVSLDSHVEAALLKALMVHTATWGSAGGAFNRVLRQQPKIRVQDIRRNTARYVGYGFARPSRAKECSESRITVVAADRISNNKGLIFRFPLPPSVASRRHGRTLTITLAYLCPMNSASRQYRTHTLWTSAKFKGAEIEGALRFRGTQGHSPFIHGGTVEHQVLEGQDAIAFVDGDAIEIQVNCKRDNGTRVKSGIPFGLAVTLEFREGITADLYAEVKARLGVPVTVETVTLRLPV